MAALILVLTLLLVAHTLALDPDIIESCINETKVNATAVKNHLSKLTYPEDDEQFQIFVVCYSRKVASLNQNEDFDWDVIVNQYVSKLPTYFSKIDPEIGKHITVAHVEDTVLYCKGLNIVGTNAGQKAIKIHNCIITNLQTHMIPKIIETCIKEDNVNANVIQAHLTQVLLPEDSEEFNKFIPCYARRVSILNENNEIDWNVLQARLYARFRTYLSNSSPGFVSHLTAEKVNAATKHCRNTTKIVLEQIGQTSIQLHNCVFKTLKSQFQSEAIETCIKDNKLNPTEIFSKIKINIPEDDDDFNTFSLCYSRRVAILNQKDEIDWDVYQGGGFFFEFKNYFGKMYPKFVNQQTFEKVNAAIVHCKDANIEGINPGQKSVKVYNCIIKTLQEQTHAHLDIPRMCLQGRNINPYSIDDNSSSLTLSEDNDELNTFVVCYTRHLSLLNEKDEINWDVLQHLFVLELRKNFGKIGAELASQLTPEKVKRSLEHCKNMNIVGKNGAQTIIKMHNCIVNTLNTVL